MNQNLIVYLISFNIQDLTNPEPIAIYLSKFGFNSSIRKDLTKKPLISNVENQYQVSFRQYVYNRESKSFWVGTKVNLSGASATYFYLILKAKSFDWDIFDLRYMNLRRFDLCYFRKAKPTDQKDDLELFRKNCCSKVLAKSKIRHVSYSRNSKGLILRIDNRKNSKYYRIYEKNNGLKFELELKHKLVKLVQEFLFLNQLKEFKKKIFKNFFFHHSINSLILNSCYTDWLSDYLRRRSHDLKLRYSLIASYLKNSNFNSLSKEEHFFRLLQFLSFFRHLKPYKKSKSPLGN